MKMLVTLVVTLCGIFASSLASAGAIEGFIQVTPDGYNFIGLQARERLPIRVTHLETLDKLKKLNNLDYFQGQGEVLENELLLQSIDFVGLRRLLGLWTSSDFNILEFCDYSKVMVYRGFMDAATPRAEIQYSIAPSTGPDWRIFFTTDKSVVIASLSLTEQSAQLRFFDLNSGVIVKTVELTRLPPTN